RVTMQPEANTHRPTAFLGPLQVELRHTMTSLERCNTAVKDVVFNCRRGTPECHDRITDELVDGPAFFGDGGCHDLEIARRLLHSSSGESCSAMEVKLSTSENSTVLKRCSMPGVSGRPDSIRLRTMPTGAKSEKERSALSSSVVACCSWAISRMRDPA